MPVAWDALGKIRKADATGTRQALERGWEGVTRPEPQLLGTKVTDALERAMTALGGKD